MEARFFVVEYKGPHGDLRRVLAQVKRYVLVPRNPPLVVAHADLIEICNNFTNTVFDMHNHRAGRDRHAGESRQAARAAL